MAERHGGGGGCCPPMDLFRSEPMQLVQIIIPIESAHVTVSYLGELGLVQFKDVRTLSNSEFYFHFSKVELNVSLLLYFTGANELYPRIVGGFAILFVDETDYELNAEKSPFQRTYAAQIKKCGEMARKLRFFKDQMLKAGLTPSIKSTTRADNNIDDLEVKLGELEAELVEMNANGEKLRRSYSELVEYKLVLHKAGEFFSSALSSVTAEQRGMELRQTAEESIETPLLQEKDLSKQIQLGFLAGLVPREKSMAFERILFRATRGNVFLKQVAVEEPVIDPASGEKVEKNVFVIFYSGERVKNKILKICEAFGANRYPFSEDLEKQAEGITEVSGRLSELKTTIDAGLLHRGNLLQTIGDQFEQWNLLVKKEKSIYHTLNMLSLDVTKKCLVAEGWSPVFATKQIQEALNRAAFDSNSQVGAIFQVLHTKEAPPTYFRTNKFTSAFQEIVDAYG
ncbi:hypothetical protein Pint_34774 [Pistacia integerrima]|uniref:Uncharacterized protein n=1 Tax=Pistacia integerrima TaxID=434235 RepID=A0ACC0X7W3_9ROSI|nr:hypothetical protein Pint_34774 [Pistacia integerrima]